MWRLEMKGNVQRWVLCAALAFVAWSPAQAGVVYEIEVTDHEQSPPKTESIQAAVEGRHLKMGIAAGGRGSQGEMIFRGDRREMVIVDHDDKTYMVLNGEAVQQLGDQVGGQIRGAMKEVEKHLEQLDPKQREMIEKMMKGKMPGGPGPANAIAQPVTTFKKTAERAKHQGYPCVRWDVFRDDEKIRELWVTSWMNIEGGAVVRDAFEDMARFHRELMESIGDMMGGAKDLFGEGENPIDGWLEVGGFPVVTRHFEGGELESETVLESITERDLDPDAFEPPKGYRLRTMGPQ